MTPERFDHTLPQTLPLTAKSPVLHARVSGFALLWAAFISPGTATAQDAPEATSPLSSIYACADIAEATARLACFDEKVASLRVREEKREVVAMDADTARELKRESFGFNMPSLPKIGLPSLGDGGEDIDGQDEVELAIESIRKSGRDLVVVMENGQVWRQVGGRVNYVPRGDLTARITSAALGSYKMSLSNGKERVRGLRVRRVQ